MSHKFWHVGHSNRSVREEIYNYKHIKNKDINILTLQLKELETELNPKIAEEKK